MNPEPTKKSSRLSRISRRFVYAAVTLITLVGLVHAVENFRGKRAWERYRKSAEGRGVKLDFSSHLPPPIPDAENGANAPFIQGWFLNPSAEDTNRWPKGFQLADSLVAVKRRTKGPGSQDDRFLPDLTAWEEAFALIDSAGKSKREKIERTSHGAPLKPEEQARAARAILDELSVYEPVLTELSAASRRPRIRYPVNYHVEDPFMILLPHLARTKTVVQELKLQVSAELAAGLTNRAFESVKLMLWLAESMKDEGFLISQLVRIAELQTASKAIWEGLVQHTWNEAQLKEFQEAMLAVNLADALSRSLDTERAAGAAFIQNAIRKNSMWESLSASTAYGGLPPASNPAGKIMSWLTPRGWLYFEMLNHAALTDHLKEKGWDVDKKLFFPAALDANEVYVKRQLEGGLSSIWQHRVFARLLVPAWTKAAQRLSRAQSTANQTGLACALERYFLRHKAYPEKLSDLMPEFIAAIPNEVVSEKAMTYVRTADGYILYSSGWDGVDDGGAFLSADKKTDAEKGDWVWRMER